MKHSPLFQAQSAMGARMGHFAGWEMPLQYTSIVEEHLSVRRGAGLFDVSHLGRIEVSGPGAADFLDSMFTRGVGELGVGRAHYDLVCREDGGILDDLMVSRTAEAEFLVVANAANTERDLEWFSRWRPPGVAVRDRSEATAMLALQGPTASSLLAQVAEAPTAPLLRFGLAAMRLGGMTTFVSRTGYTGEDGFEVIAQAADAVSLWQTLLARGATPCGLGARDTLRLEAGLLLHGQDMDTTTNPFEAGLDWVVRLDSHQFIGKNALVEARRRGPRRRLAGLKVPRQEGIPRPGYRVLRSGEEVGHITSGSYSPSLRVNIALAYLPPDLSAPGIEVEVWLRDRAAPARVVPLPFYRRGQVV